MRDLTVIEEDFTIYDALEEPVRTNRLVQLMNELETYHQAFIVNPTATELEAPAVQLYKRISLARNI